MAKTVTFNPSRASFSSANQFVFFANISALLFSREHNGQNCAQKRVLCIQYKNMFCHDGRTRGMNKFAIKRSFVQRRVMKNFREVQICVFLNLGEWSNITHGPLKPGRNPLSGLLWSTKAASQIVGNVKQKGPKPRSGHPLYSRWLAEDCWASVRCRWRS